MTEESPFNVPMNLIGGSSMRERRTLYPWEFPVKVSNLVKRFAVYI
jgi:hypothetical protein